MTVATAVMSSSSNAAPIKMGCGKEVAYEKLPLPLKLTPGELATPWRASCHQVYAGRPNRGTPGLSLPVLLSFSSRVKRLIRAVALAKGSEHMLSACGIHEKLAVDED